MITVAAGVLGQNKIKQPPLTFVSKGVKAVMMRGDGNHSSGMVAVLSKKEVELLFISERGW